MSKSIKIEIRETTDTLSTESRGKTRKAKVTDPVMNAFEYAKLLEENAKRLKIGGILKVDDIPPEIENEKDPLKKLVALAKYEIEQRVAPFEIVRHLPDGRIENWSLKEMDITDG